MNANPVSTDTVRDLLTRQFPQWSRLPIERIGAHGTVNTVFRLGDHLTARFPRHDTEDLLAEARAARELLGVTRFATPQPLAIGEPGPGFPRRWAVQTWLPGTVASENSHSTAISLGYDLAELVQGVRGMDTRGRPFRGRGRGGDLRAHDDWMAECFRQSEPMLDVGPLRALWAELRELPRESPDVMTHGDLIPGNLLTEGDRLIGVLDVGMLGPADPALDLICGWHLFDDPVREAWRTAVGGTGLDWARGRAWAFVQAMGLVWYYVETNPVMAGLGRSTLRRVA
ncbi:aminoglycoside phosphotransferase [Actinoplanes sp. SE50]|uniref:aminoglycoside phosphotransferase family protein n=1 Tax=unclassified Actinoplanes TaxID=2626549 RepID=UPI00023EC9C1|nr:MULTISPECIES: aminoglycoside phosphotransferase family protein [unclassified Actinoplanes]AEV85952.1 Homoserine kinase [Actinoplanes sp. SE50/110]ATO84350.1 aminoglycoside phosphotransferase [Actinoplanes sp. SE50]SLM01760.1 aminoglycoside phosphotransferase [Actinoplanes sp. SE50/110]